MWGLKKKKKKAASQSSAMEKTLMASGYYANMDKVADCEHFPPNHFPYQNKFFLSDPKSEEPCLCSYRMQHLYEGCGIDLSVFVHLDDHYVCLWQGTSSYSPSKRKTSQELRVQTAKVVFMRSLLIVGYYSD